MAAAFPYRVIMTRANGHTSEVVRLSQAPHIGDQLTLADGVKVRVWRVLSPDENTVSGVLLTEPEE